MNEMNGNSNPETAFAGWVQRIPGRQLKCRVQEHRFPDWDDRRRTRIYASGGIVHIETECARGCGTTATTFLDQDGYITRARRILHYDPQFRYLMPKEARGPGLTRERRAAFRKEFILRQADYITQE